MTSESRTELIIAGGVAVFLVMLWWLNQQGQASVGDMLLPFGIGSGPNNGVTASGQPIANVPTSPADITLTSVPGATGPDFYSTNAPVYNIGGSQISVGGSGGSSFASGPVFLGGPTIDQLAAPSQAAMPPVSAGGCGCGTAGSIAPGAMSYGSEGDLIQAMLAAPSEMWANTVAANNLATYQAAQASGAPWPSWQ